METALECSAAAGAHRVWSTVVVETGFYLLSHLLITSDAPLQLRLTQPL